MGFPSRKRCCPGVLPLHWQAPLLLCLQKDSTLFLGVLNRTESGRGGEQSPDTPEGGKGLGVPARCPPWKGASVGQRACRDPPRSQHARSRSGHPPLAVGPGVFPKGAQMLEGIPFRARSSARGPRACKSLKQALKVDGAFGSVPSPSFTAAPVPQDTGLPQRKRKGAPAKTAGADHCPGPVPTCPTWRDKCHLSGLSRCCQECLHPGVLGCQAGERLLWKGTAAAHSAPSP